jgi:hypothetical protein
VVLADLRGHIGVAVEDLAGAQPEQVLIVFGESRRNDVRSRCRGELNEEAANTTGAPMTSTVAPSESSSASRAASAVIPASGATPAVSKSTLSGLRATELSSGTTT